LDGELLNLTTIITLPQQTKLTPEDLDYWKPTGFKRVCQVTEDERGHWFYAKIDRSILYSTHTSWVYLIVVNNKIYKIGESGLPLGIEARHGQPIRGTTTRIGRYIANDGTDARIRSDLSSIVRDPNSRVEFWAFECPETQATLQVGDTTITLKSHIHHDLEKTLIDHYTEHIGKRPDGNPNRA
jgi:hypothetical protein